MPAAASARTLAAFFTKHLGGANANLYGDAMEVANGSGSEDTWRQVV